MKLKNAYLFILACIILACDYAIAGYPMPSILLSTVASTLSLAVLNPSRKLMGKLLIQNSSIAIIEIMILVFIGHASTWSFAFLTLSIVVSCGCWRMIYLNHKKRIKGFIVNSVQYMMIGFLVSSLISVLIPGLSVELRMEILHYLILIFTPVLLTIIFTYLQIEVKYNITLEPKKGYLQLHEMKR